MTDTLLHAYVPLVIWTGLGLLLMPVLPTSFPRWLGRGLYWLGVPLQIFTLAHQGNFSMQVALVPAIAIWTLLLGLLLSSLALWILESRSRGAVLITTPPSEHPVASPESFWTHMPRRGAFMISSIVGNTGFVGLAVVPTFIPEPYQGWVVMYSVTNNVLGTYGVGVLLASFYGRFPAGEAGQTPTRTWVTLLRDILTVPSLWAFGAGMLSRSLLFPPVLETGLRASLWVIIPSALLLMGIRLRQIKGWQGLRLGTVPSLIKVVLLPLAIGVTATLLHLPAAPRLAMTLMAGMPAAFAGLILAEEYDLDRELIASSIVVSTVALFVTIPLWLVLFGSAIQGA